MRIKMFLDKLKTKPKDLHLIIIMVPALVFVTIVYSCVFMPINIATDYTILQLINAGTVERVQELFMMLGPASIQYHIIGVYWDMPFILSYVLLLFGCFLLISRRTYDRLMKICLWVCFIPVLVGILDFCENINLLIMLHNPASFPSYVPMLTTVLGSIKFVFLAICVVFFLVVSTFVIIAYFFRKLG